MSPEEIFEMFSEIEYGWVDKENVMHKNDFDTFSNKYKLQTPEELTKSKIGVCWDQVELERKYFEDNGVTVRTYFIVHYDNDKCPTHTFLIYEKENKYFWFEHSWFKYRGIHKYNCLKELLSDVRDKFIIDQLDGVFNKDNLCVYEYSKPKYGISVIDFYNNCENGINIDIDNL
jgi:hypothetical protein